MRSTALVLAILSAVAGLPGSAAQTPRYAVEAGQHVVYRRVARVTEEGQTRPPRVQQLQYWVLTGARRAEVLGELTEVVEQAGRCVGGLMLEIDDRGPAPLADEFVPQLDELATLLEPWPNMPDALRATDDWRTTDSLGRVFVYRGGRPDPAHDNALVWEVTLDRERGTGAALEQDYRGRMWFDPQRRIVVRLEGTWQQAEPQTRTDVQVELYQVGTVTADWMLRRRDEVRRYRNTLGLQQRYLDRLSREPDRADALLGDVNRFWAELAFQFASRKTPIRRFVDGRRRAWEAGLSAWQQRARQIAAWRDERAPKWLLFTADGRAVRSEELGVPVLEVLWSPRQAACGATLAAMTDLRGRIPLAGLAIVCIHLHGNAEALEAARTLTGPEILHLRPELPAYDDALRLPIVRLRDAEGTVRQVSYGPRPVWEAWLADEIDAEEGD